MDGNGDNGQALPNALLQRTPNGSFEKGKSASRHARTVSSYYRIQKISVDDLELNSLEFYAASTWSQLAWNSGALPCIFERTLDPLQS